MEALKQKFSNRSFKFVSRTGNSEPTKVEVVLPDLQNAELNVWGCWGPMYNIELDKGKSIEVVYDGKSFKLDQRNIEFSSPICAEQRQFSPLYCVIKDKERDCNFNIYLDADASVRKVEVESSKDKEWYQNFEGSTVAEKNQASA